MSTGPCPRQTWSRLAETSQKNTTLSFLVGPSEQERKSRGSRFSETTNDNHPKLGRKCCLDTSDRPDCQAFPATYTCLVRTWNLSQAIRGTLGLVSFKC